jgi:DNA-directed RNA polymerase subunit RPC12/RpoP
MYSDEDYSCPNCGTPDSECSSNGSWGYVCSGCGDEFETPDV